MVLSEMFYILSQTTVKPESSTEQLAAIDSTHCDVFLFYFMFKEFEFLQLVLF